ncbi:ly6/PLAUR domain-containing protein 3 isoform X2 [Hyperolius riggenbachi]|uniref:ly6/PLAUR domain-containing protein 3 isoform X2 n=1 Tax=Hyperolius riggenbachi TaxID=752182 RepID=UPI0035A3B6D9
MAIKNAGHCSGRTAGVQSQATECYACTDEGDGGCLPDKARNMSCSTDHDVCMEVITAVTTSHYNHVVLKKGCGNGMTTVMEKNILYHGISIYIQLNQCNESFCNTNMDLKNYQLAPAVDNATRQPNDGQCYSCIGKPDVGCSRSHSPTTQCYDSYEHCFDGNITVSIDNDTTVIPIKSCSQRYYCTSHSLDYGNLNFDVRGACCSEDLCNKDLSNKTQLAEVPYLTLLNEDNEEVTTTVLPPRWIIPTEPMTSFTTQVTSPNMTSIHMARNSHATMACGHLVWLALLLMLLS